MMNCQSYGIGPRAGPALVADLQSVVGAVGAAVGYAAISMVTVAGLCRLLARRAPARWRFVRSHLLDLLVLVVPFLRPLRAPAAAANRPPRGRGRRRP